MNTMNAFAVATRVRPILLASLALALLGTSAHAQLTVIAGQNVSQSQLQPVKTRSRQFRQLATLIGQYHLVAAPGENRRTEPVFNICDVARDCRLGDRQFFGRARKAAVPGGSLKRQERIQRRETTSLHIVR